MIAERGYTAATIRHYHGALRRVLVYLWEHHGAPKLDQEVRRVRMERPRNVVAQEDEIEAVLSIAPPHIRLWLLLCADLGIRSGTAARLGWRDYDKADGKLRFVTKFGSKLTLPTTSRIRELIKWTTAESEESFVRQLQRRFTRGGLRSEPVKDFTSSLHVAHRKLREQAGLKRRVWPHDMRRRAAVKVYEATRDLRAVQAILGHRHLATTLWYLDHDAQPVDEELIRSIQTNHTIERKLA